MKKKLIYPLACLALLAASCDSTETTPAAPQDGGGPTVTFSVNSETKAADGTLTDIFYPTEQNGDGMYIGEQHAKYVYLYIFRGSDSDATCVACENVGWDTYWETLPEKTAEMTYTIQYDNFIYAQPYTLMAVGLSEGAQDVYGITVEADDATGTTLGDALAVLQSGKTCADIRTAEVYAGTEVYTPDGNKKLEITINGRSRSEKIYFYNERNDVSKITSVNGSKKEDTTVEYVYDEQGNWISRTQRTGADLSTTRRIIEYYNYDR